MVDEEITNENNIYYYIGALLIAMLLISIGWAANKYFYTDEKDWRLIQAKTFLNGPACDILVIDNSTVTCYPITMSQFISTAWCSTNHTSNTMVVSGCINPRNNTYRIGN